MFVRAYPDTASPGAPGAASTPGSTAAAHRFVAAVALGGGKFRIAPISPGSYHIAVTDGVNGFRDPPKAVVNVAPPYPVVAEIALDRSAALQGQVVDDHGQPLSDVWVDAKCNGAGQIEPRVVCRPPRSFMRPPKGAAPSPTGVVISFWTDSSRPEHASSAPNSRLVASPRKMGSLRNGRED